MKVHVYEIVDFKDRHVYITLNEYDSWDCYVGGICTNHEKNWGSEPHNAFMPDDKSIELIAEAIELKEALALINMHLLVS